jgi:hypothetical protein
MSLTSDVSDVVRQRRRPNAGLRRRAAKPRPMRAIFALYLTLIVAGVVFCTVIGLTHN